LLTTFTGLPRLAAARRCVALAILLATPVLPTPAAEGDAPTTSVTLQCVAQPAPDAKAVTMTLRSDPGDKAARGTPSGVAGWPVGVAIVVCAVVLVWISRHAINAVKEARLKELEFDLAKVAIRETAGNEATSLALLSAHCRSVVALLESATPRPSSDAMHKALGDACKAILAAASSKS
jgi:hypothetical protein